MSDPSSWKIVNHSPIKKDAMALVTGQPVYTDDLAPSHCLIVKVLRSPHANALIRSVDKAEALSMPGIACVLTHEDAPMTRFTIAGQTYPEFSPYDRRILDDHVRFVGDAVALVAGDTEQQVMAAMQKIKVDYEVLEPILDFRLAKDHAMLVHPEENWHTLVPVGADQKRNLVCSGIEDWQDVEAVLADCDLVSEATFHTKQNQQVMMETFRSYTFLDAFGRLNVVSSTQIPFHVRRILATALEIAKSRLRVIKPRIGGGFGAKQSAVCEMYPALVTMKTKKPAKIVYTRYESQIASSPRHETEIKVRVGANRDGKIRAIDLNTLSNSGAYGEHGPTTVGLSGHKSISLYGSLEAFRFTYQVVYTNQIASGAYRGYGATQGTFALESVINDLADRLGMDAAKIREMNMVREGQFMPAYYGETATSCALDRCLAKAKTMIGWDAKYPVRDLGNGKVRALGISLAMQGSGIASVDTGTVSIKLNDEGFYTMAIGATDMGTGCDTILAQIAAESLECALEDIIVDGVDTDTSPYDSGSYASSTTYITGMAVVKACDSLKAAHAETSRRTTGSHGRAAGLRRPAGSRFSQWKNRDAAGAILLRPVQQPDRAFCYRSACLTNFTAALYGWHCRDRAGSKNLPI